jgi:hypothetical protein
MSERIPEKTKKPGICYAWTDDGIELPVIDITQPAFAFAMSEAEASALIDAMQRSSKTPVAVLQSIATKSILVRGLVESAGTFTTGMMTYLNKLGPDNLGDGYAGPIDRQWAASLTPVTFRWRMRDVIHLLVDGLVLALESRPGAPLHLINLAGGPSIDSLNALIVLRKERPELLADRSISIHVLDIDPEGPHFGQHALEALQADNAPLHELRVNFEWVAYDWNQSARLQQLLDSFEPSAAVMGSTEGGLFEYASDEAIIANLKVLRDGTPPDFRMIGPVVRDPASSDPRLGAMDQVEGRPAIRFMGLKAFARLAAAAGWSIERTLDSPMHQVVSLMKSF